MINNVLCVSNNYLNQEKGSVYIGTFLSKRQSKVAQYNRYKLQCFLTTKRYPPCQLSLASERCKLQTKELLSRCELNCWQRFYANRRTLHVTSKSTCLLANTGNWSPGYQLTGFFRSLKFNIVMVRLLQVRLSKLFSLYFDLMTVVL